MTFSRRSEPGGPPTPWAQEIDCARREGRVRWDLTVSNPTLAGFAHGNELWAHLAETLSAADLGRYDADPWGLPSARQAVAAWMTERGTPISPANLLLTASTSEAYAYAFKLLADAGDNLLIPAPSYPLFAHLAALEGVELREYPLGYDGAWHLDRQALFRAVDPKTRAIIVVNPNNPTGSYLSDAEIAVMDELGLPIISDEVFADYPLERSVPGRSLLGATQQLTLAFGGLSKLAALPQLKLAWLSLAGPPEEVAEARRRLELIADTYLSVGSPVQLALPQILSATAPLRAAIHARCRRNLSRLRALLTPTSATVLRAEGGWNAVLHLPGTRTEEEWVTLLLKQGLLVQPGWFYDFGSEPFVVLSLLIPEDTFSSGVHVLMSQLTR